MHRLLLQLPRSHLVQVVDSVDVHLSLWLWGLAAVGEDLAVLPGVSCAMISVPGGVLLVLLDDLLAHASLVFVSRTHQLRIGTPVGLANSLFQFLRNQIAPLADLWGESLPLRSQCVFSLFFLLIFFSLFFILFILV